MAKAATKTVKPTMALPMYQQKKRRNKILILGLLSLLLLGLGILFVRYYFTRETPLPLVEEAKEGTIIPPTFLFVITGGPGDLALSKPLGVAVHSDGNIYVTTFIGRYGAGRVEVFDHSGTYLFSFDEVGEGKKLRSPTYMAINKQGNIYVSDKRQKAIFVFSKDGKFIRKFVPDNNPDFAWDPLAMAFDKNGNFYVTDVYTEHQVLIFDSRGRLIRKFGSSGAALKKKQNLGKFLFPNGIAVDQDGKIFVADSNNRRIQVFNSNGKFLYSIETGGLPRGIGIDEQNRLYIVDSLGHDVSIYDKRGKGTQAMAIFGEQGIEFGQFLYPNGMTLGDDGRIYVTDRENNRVQVFGWPPVSAIPAPIRKALPSAAVLLPFLLLFIWWMVRRRRYYASSEFVAEVVDHGHLNDLAKKYKKVYVSKDTYEAVKGYEEDELHSEDVFRPIKHDEEDVKNFAKSYKVSKETAILFTRAQKGITRSRILAEENEAHLAARKFNLESMNHELFMEFHNVKPRKAA